MTDILFLTLKVFSATGGIEKVCRVAGKALYEYGISYNKSVQIYSMHDDNGSADNNKYFPGEQFRGFNAQKMQFIRAAVQKGKSADVVILSHINLLLVGWMIKKISPETKLLLFAHGIEIWSKLTSRRRMMLDSCDEIISVSKYTCDRLQETHGIGKEKCSVLNNCLDPFLPLPAGRKKEKELLEKYSFNDSDKIILTLTRLSSKERYKGYDKVLQAMVSILKRRNNIRYLLAGSYDTEEKEYLDNLIRTYKLEGFVALPGYVADEELSSHFALADMYVMPSMKEGFGIVFIEAMYYGLPVIAGNMDGSVDALCNGELGILVDPLNPDAIQQAIEQILDNPETYYPKKEKLLANFSYDNYKIKFNSIVDRQLNKKDELKYAG